MHAHRSSLGVRRAPSRDLSSRSSREEASSPSNRIRIAADVHSHSHSDDDSGCIVDDYAWVPSGVRPDTVHAYFSALPAERVPVIGSSGAKWRLRQLRHQLPPHDSDAAYCGHLKGEDEQRQLVHFDKRRQEECLGRGTVQIVPYDRSPICTQCSTPIEEGSVGVWADRVASWFHPACFVCTGCRELLVDLVYFKHEGGIFCGRHHAEKYRPRCARCDELIFSSECAEAEGHSWHVEHFRCALCDGQLGGHHYARNAAGQVVCSSCRRLPSCTGCNQVLNANEASVVQGDLQWHATHRCFRCGVCARSLLGHPFALSPVTSSSRSSNSSSGSGPNITLRCSPSCPRPTRSMEHIYETVMSSPSTSGSPYSPRRREPRKLHPCQSERVVGYRMAPGPLRGDCGGGGYECLRPSAPYSDLSNYYSSSSSSSVESDDDDLVCPAPPPPPAPRKGPPRPQTLSTRASALPPRKKKPHPPPAPPMEKASPKHLPYATRKQNKCIVS